MILSTLTASLFIAKLLDSEDGSGTLLTIILSAALMFFGGETPQPLANAGAAIDHIATKFQNTGGQK